MIFISFRLKIQFLKNQSHWLFTLLMVEWIPINNTEKMAFSKNSLKDFRDRGRKREAWIGCLS